MSILKNSILTSVALLTGILMPHVAIADEKWSTEEYDVTYQEDRNRTAIWTYGSEDQVIGTIFIDGLAGVYQDRGFYHGYWTQETASLRCDTFREGADGKLTYYWGRFEVYFRDPNFPSRWQAKFGLCDREKTITLNGTPIIAP